LYPDNAKVAKQFQHADKRSSFAVIVGTRNTSNSFSENLVSGEQTSLDFEGLKKRYCNLNLYKKKLC
jgi:histidyl-tRNA synthetase